MTHEEFSKRIKELNVEVAQNKKDNEALRKENERLAEEITNLNSRHQKTNWERFRASEEKLPKELVVSDFMLKLIDENKLDDTKLACIPGGSIQKLKEELGSPKYHGSQLDRIVIMAGSNDLNGDDENCVETMIKKYDDLLDAAKAIATEVSVSTLCPCLDSLQDKVESFNNGLTELCDRKECHLISHANSFTLAAE